MSFYLTCSINVPSVGEAFALVGKRLQPGVTRVPDGDPAARGGRHDAGGTRIAAIYSITNPDKLTGIR